MTFNCVVGNQYFYSNVGVKVKNGASKINSTSAMQLSGKTKNEFDILPLQIDCRIPHKVYKIFSGDIFRQGSIISLLLCTMWCGVYTEVYVMRLVL